jgi:hypothetical protein
MKRMVVSLALAALMVAAFAPPGHAAPKLTAKQKACKAQAITQVRQTMGKAAQTNKAAAKAKGMGYYKQCMAA